MYDLMIYSLKVGACLAVFYLFFKLLLSRETFHRLNRMVLLVAMVLSFVLPIGVITIYHEVPALPEITEFVGVPVVMDTEPEPFPWDRIAGGVFLLGAFVTLGVTLCSLASVIRLIRRGRREPFDAGMVLVRVDRPVTPFSWGRYIVLSEQDAAESGREIITHERAHLRLHHSWDLLVTDVAGCLQWFNPAMWLLRRELRAIHEYEADEAVLNSGVDAKQYQLLLIKKAAGGRWYSVANSFNHSKLKNRITMMLQKRSSRWAGAKALLVLPLIGLALGAFAETAYVYPKDKGTKENVAIPAPESEIKVVGYRTEAKTPAAQKIDDVKVIGSRTMVKDGTHLDTLAFRISEKTAALNEKQRIWILDGKEIDKATFEVLNQKEIASISVLKDASAKKMFPDRDVDGVILVTTKKAEAEAKAATEAVATEGKVVGFHVIDKEEAKSPMIIHIKGSDPVNTKLSNPLIIIDGERSSETTMKTLAPNQINSISVRKDKKTVEMYGPEAVNGVIFITTKVAVKAPESAAHGLSIGMRDGHFDCPEVALYLLDGKKSSKAELEGLDPNTVRSVAVFTGPEAVKKYGKKARNGVVVFKTRK